VTQDTKLLQKDLLSQGRIQSTAQNLTVQLQQNEVMHIRFKDSPIRLVIRFVPVTGVVPLIPPLMLSSGELMGILIALAASLLMFLAVSTSQKEELPDDEDELTRVAQIVFDNKPQPVPPVIEQKPPEEEVKKVVEHLANSYNDDYPESEIEFEKQGNEGRDAIFESMGIGEENSDDVDDDLYEEAKEIVVSAGKASTSYLQRKLRIGYSRAARLMDILEDKGVIGPADGSKPREVLGNDNSSNE
jgi:hypothetical protein